MEGSRVGRVCLADAGGVAVDRVIVRACLFCEPWSPIAPQVVVGRIVRNTLYEDIALHPAVGLSRKSPASPVQIGSSLSLRKRHAIL